MPKKAAGWLPAEVGPNIARRRLFEIGLLAIGGGAERPLNVVADILRWAALKFGGSHHLAKLLTLSGSNCSGRRSLGPGGVDVRLARRCEPAAPRSKDGDCGSGLVCRNA